MQEYTIHPLTVGINETDQGLMTYLHDYGKRILLPIYVFYIKGGIVGDVMFRACLGCLAAMKRDVLQLISFAPYH